MKNSDNATSHRLENGQSAKWRDELLGQFSRFKCVNNRVGGHVGYVGQGGAEYGLVGVVNQNAV